MLACSVPLQWSLTTVTGHPFQASPLISTGQRAETRFPHGPARGFDLLYRMAVRSAACRFLVLCRGEFRDSKPCDRSRLAEFESWQHCHTYVAAAGSSYIQGNCRQQRISCKASEGRCFRATVPSAWCGCTRWPEQSDTGSCSCT